MELIDPKQVQPLSFSIMDSSSESSTDGAAHTETLSPTMSVSSAGILSPSSNTCPTLQASTTIERFIEDGQDESHARVNSLAAPMELSGLTAEDLGELDDALDVLGAPEHTEPSWSSSSLTAADATVFAAHDPECAFELRESSFEQWLDHIIDEHLGPRPLGSMTCPLCPEQLLPANTDHSGRGDQAATRQHLQHLRVHAPWLAGRCEWDLFLQYSN